MKSEDFNAVNEKLEAEGKKTFANPRNCLRDPKTAGSTGS